jgi:hypothetical protein
MNKSYGQGKLSAHETSETPRCQAIASLVTPYEVKEGSKAKEGRRSKGTLNEPSEYPFTFLRETITAWVNGKARCFASFAMAWSVMQVAHFRLRQDSTQGMQNLSRSLFCE